MEQKKKQSPRYEYWQALIAWGLYGIHYQPVKDLIHYFLYVMSNENLLVPCSIHTLRIDLRRHPKTIRATVRILFDLGIVLGYQYHIYAGNKIEVLQLTGEVPKITYKEANELIKKVVPVYTQLGTGGGCPAYEVWGVPFMRYGLSRLATLRRPVYSKSIVIYTVPFQSSSVSKEGQDKIQDLTKKILEHRKE